MPEIVTSSLFEIATAFVTRTDRSIFLTGKAGTGKTTFLRKVRDIVSKKSVIVAPTGVAAINAGGVTMHSFFQLPLGAFIPIPQYGFSQSPQGGTDLPTLLRSLRYNREKRKMIEELELLIIDEVSMLRADMLDAIDGILRHVRKRPDTPFGGVQILYIGDLHQLPPVVGDAEWGMLSQYYKSMFFFDSLVLQEQKPICIELDTIYRQSDDRFIHVLNNIRNNEATEEDLALLNRRNEPDFHPDPDEGYIVLTSHNYKADKINQNALARLQGEIRQFEGKVNGDFNDSALPAERTLVLKPGAQIMFIRNDKGDARRYYNGKIGQISRIRDQEIYVRFPGESGELKLEKEVWRNIRYNYNESADKIEEQELGSYEQYPIRLAWAVTIHKSQGLTFEKAIIDAGQSFAAGQVYVALSRLTSLSGLILASPITAAAIHTDTRISSFASSAQLSSSQLTQELRLAQREYIGKRLLESFDLRKLYGMLQEHHMGYNERKLPHQAEAVAWSAELVRQAGAMKDVAERFSGQLRQLLQISEDNNYGHLNERVQAARDYFVKSMEEQLIAPLRKHTEESKVKSKVKKYLKDLSLLQGALLRKRQQLEGAAGLVSGMMQGKDAAQLLDYYEVTIRQEPSLPKIASSKKGETRELSLKMFQEGKDVEQIAAERGLAKSTVEGHLISYIVTGEVKAEMFVSREKELKIREAILKSGEKQLSPVKAMLGEDYSFTEIKAVQALIEREGLM